MEIGEQERKDLFSFYFLFFPFIFLFFLKNENDEKGGERNDRFSVISSAHFLFEEEQEGEEKEKSKSF